MRKKLPLDENGLIANLNVLNPKVAQDLSQSPESIVPSAAHFPHVVPQNMLNELDDQWRAFRVSAKDLGIPADCVPEYRHHLGSIKQRSANGGSRPKFGSRRLQAWVAKVLNVQPT